MGKRKDYLSLSDKDLWPTIDPRAAQALAPFIKGQTYAEPCYGYGDLERLLDDYTEAKCLYRSDIDPEEEVSHFINKGRAEEIPSESLKGVDLVITNPPFSWAFLQPILDHLPNQTPTWLLLPSDMMHNKRMVPYMNKCREVVSVGRLYWMDNKVRGVDNFAWFSFVSWGTSPIFYTNPVWNADG